MTTKALSLRLAIFEEINNISQNIGSFFATFLNTNNNILVNNFTVEAGGSFSFTPTAGNKITVIVTKDALSLTINFVANSDTLTQTINNLWVIDSEVSGITLNNTSSSDIDVTVFSG